MVRNATSPKPEVLRKNHRKKLFLQKTEHSSESPKHPEWFVFLNSYHKWFLGFLGKLRKNLGEYSDLPCNSRVDELAAWIHTHTHTNICVFVHLCASYTREMTPTVTGTSTAIPATGTRHQTPLWPQLPLIKLLLLQMPAPTECSELLMNTLN